jgi:hypothetical protein
MDLKRLEEIRSRAQAALAMDLSRSEVKEGDDSWSKAEEGSDKEIEDEFGCPLCDGEGYVEGARYDASFGASTVVAYGIGKGLHKAEEWVAHGPEDALELIAAIEHKNYWYSTRFERLREWVLKEVQPLSEEVARRYFSIVANGVAEGEQPSYAQLHNHMVHQLEELRASTQKAHRRAQALEGADKRLASARDGYRREVARIRASSDEKGRFWNDLYKQAVAQIEALGVDSRIDGQDNYRTGYLDEMIRRLQAMYENQIEAARKEERANLASRVETALRRDLGEQEAKRICSELGI